MNIIKIAAISIFFPVLCFAQCPFSNIDLNDLFRNNQNQFITEYKGQTDLPSDFQRHDSLKAMKPKSCDGHMEKIVIIDLVSRKRYDGIITNDDACDGGNYYGLIYDQTTHQAVAIVQDGDIQCLTK